MTAEAQPQKDSLVRFYTQLFTCVWDSLVPFLGAQTTLELIAHSRQALYAAYPFLSRLEWRPEGLVTSSLEAAIASEDLAHVQAGCERLLQDIQTVVQHVGGTMLAQRLHAATEGLRLAFEPALSTPAPLDEMEGPLTPADPQAAALPLMQSMAQRALAMYLQLETRQKTVERLQAEVEALRQSALVPSGATDEAARAYAELARSEAFYHSLFELSPDGVVVTTMEGIILLANPRVAEILEFDTPDELIGRNAREFYVHPEERDTLLQQIAQHQHVNAHRRDMHTRRGKTIVTMASTRLIDFDGQPCLLSVLRDVTERARLRQEMEDFAYSASHDLQAPLRTFEGYARWLLEDYGEALDQTGRQLCEEIIADALHMKKLLDGLLEYSRIGRLHTQAVAVDVKKVLDQVLHNLQLEILDSGARIQVPPTLPTVYYPEVRLTQIFSNLLSNALKFTGGKTPEVTIEWESLPRHYRFTVRDHGIGIAPEHVDRIFEIFKRLHTRDEYPGTGAGLTIVKKIVESHGGQVGVESTPGEGSTFWFTVPKTEAPACDS